jgi:hypothetical protein
MFSWIIMSELLKIIFVSWISLNTLYHMILLGDFSVPNCDWTYSTSFFSSHYYSKRKEIVIHATICFLGLNQQDYVSDSILLDLVLSNIMELHAYIYNNKLVKSTVKTYSFNWLKSLDDNLRPEAKHFLKYISKFGKTGHTVHSLMELNTSWEPANCAAIQELPSIVWNPKVHYHVHKSPLLVPILKQIDPVYTTPSCLCKIRAWSVWKETKLSF